MPKSSISSTVPRGNKRDEQPNQSENEIIESAWAVCVRPQNIDDTREPWLFKKKQEAEAFLEIEPPFSKKREVARNKTLLDLEAGMLSSHEFPEYLKRKKNRYLGWSDPVPVLNVILANSKMDTLLLREFLPVDALGAIPTVSLDEMFDRAFEDRLGGYAYSLDQDWRFAEIEADARKRIGHEFRGLKYTRVVEIVVKAVYDLEDSLLKFHPTISAASRAAFFRSWQVQRHIAILCDRVGRSETAHAISNGNGQQHAASALEFMYQKLAVYTHTLSAEGVDAPLWPELRTGESKPEIIVKKRRGRPQLACRAGSHRYHACGGDRDAQLALDPLWGDCRLRLGTI